MLAVLALVLSVVVGDRVTVDWTAGEARATGVALADLRLPGPDIARVAAERAARRDAGQRLAAALAALPWAEGGTVGARLDAEALGKLVDGGATRVEYGSDGSAAVVVAVSLDQVRSAIAGPAVGGEVLVIDARGLDVAPVLGARVAGAATATTWTSEAPPGVHLVPAAEFAAGAFRIDEALARPPGKVTILVKETK